MSGLYKGMSSPMIGVAFINAVVFGVYGNIQRSFPNRTSLTSHFVAGCAAGIVQSFICGPMELAKTRMQLQGQGKLCINYDSKIPYSSPLDCLMKMHKLEGASGIFRGLGSCILRDSPAFAVYFSSYEFMTRKILSNQSGHICTFAMMMAGGCAGTLSWVISYPVDVIKSRIQADGMHGARQYKGICDCAIQSYYKEGIMVFTRGLGSTLIRAFPTNAATFTVVTWVFKLSEQQEVLELRREKQRPNILVDKDRTNNILY